MLIATEQITILPERYALGSMISSQSVVDRLHAIIQPEDRAWYTCQCGWDILVDLHATSVIALYCRCVPALKHAYCSE